MTMQSSSRLSLSAIGNDIATASLTLDHAKEALEKATGKTILALLCELSSTKQDTPQELNTFLVSAMRATITNELGDIVPGSKAQSALDSANRRIRKAIPALNGFRKAEGQSPLFFWACNGNRHGSLFSHKPPVETVKAQANKKQITAKGKGQSQMRHADAPDTAASIKADTVAMAAALAPTISPAKAMAAALANGSLSIAEAQRILAAAIAKADKAAAAAAAKKASRKAAAIIQTGKQKAAAAAPSRIMAAAMVKAQEKQAKEANRKAAAVTIEQPMVDSMACGM